MWLHAHLHASTAAFIALLRHFSWASVAPASASRASSILLVLSTRLPLLPNSWTLPRVFWLSLTGKGKTEFWCSPCTSARRRGWSSSCSEITTMPSPCTAIRGRCVCVCVRGLGTLSGNPAVSPGQQQKGQKKNVMQACPRRGIDRANRSIVQASTTLISCRVRMYAIVRVCR